MQILKEHQVTVLNRKVDVDALVSEATRTVPPLWPLESAIAVNPLAGFEDQPFEQAVDEAAALFGARATMPLPQWQALLARGEINERALMDVAIEHLGGLDAAFELIGTNVSRIDLLMLRLTGDMGAAPEPDARAAAAVRFTRQARSSARTVLSPAERAGTAMLGYARAFVAKWCGAFFDRSIACAGMPYRNLGLYRAVLKLAAHDPDFWRFGGDDSAAIIASAEPDPEEAIEQGLIALGLDGQYQLDLLRTLVARLPGWAGHIRWRQEHGDVALCAARPAGMADYLALWLLVERACALKEWPREAFDMDSDPAIDTAARLASRFGIGAAEIRALSREGAAALFGIASMNDAELGRIWLRAAERSYRDGLIPQIERAAAALPPVPETRPAAQLVMCIDVRSEPFRRAIEAQGAYETFGYAGFFGLPVSMVAPSGDRRKLLPVLLTPAYDLMLKPAGPEGEKALGRQHCAHAGGDLIQTLKTGAATAFATAEALGPFGAAISAARTLAPKTAKLCSGG